MAPNSDRGVAESTLQSAIDKLTTEIDRFDPEFRKLVSIINRSLHTAAFVSPLGALLFSRKVQGKVETLHGKLNELADEVGKILAASTPIFSLISVSALWTEEVLPELSGAVGLARDIRANALHAWGGDAGRAYQEKRWGQAKALEGTTGDVKDTAQWLVDVAVLNAKFLIAITQPVIDVVQSMIEAAIDAASVAGVLEAIGAVAEAIARSAGSILEIVKQTADHTYESLSKLSEARIILNDNTVFPGEGSWPQAVNR